VGEIYTVCTCLRMWLPQADNEDISSGLLLKSVPDRRNSPGYCNEDVQGVFPPLHRNL